MSSTEEWKVRFLGQPDPSPETMQQRPEAAAALSASSQL
jgi:hypothetical protein